MSCRFCRMLEDATFDIKPLHPKAVIPSKRREDSGYDVYGLFEEKSYIMLRPGDNAVIRTGLSMQFPNGLGFAIKNRSSNGIKGAIVGAELVDSGYRGEVHIDVHNISNKIMFLTDLTLEELHDRAYEISRLYFKNEYSKGHLIDQFLQEDMIKLIHQDNALIQGVIIPTIHLPIRIIDSLEPSERGQCKFGSTNKMGGQ